MTAKNTLEYFNIWLNKILRFFLESKAKRKTKKVQKWYMHLDNNN